MVNDYIYQIEIIFHSIQPLMLHGDCLHLPDCNCYFNLYFTLSNFANIIYVIYVLDGDSCFGTEFVLQYSVVLINQILGLTSILLVLDS